MEMGEWGDGVKFCKRCDTIKPLTEFNRNKARPDGLQGQCRLCSNKICRDHYTNNQKDYIRRNRENRYTKRTLLSEYLEGKICLDCGNSDKRVLEFDHLRDKKFNISESFNHHTWKKISIEISKCDIVCANCHRIRTIERLGKCWRKIGD